MARKAPQAPIGGGQARGQLVNPVGGSARIDSAAGALNAAVSGIVQYAGYEHNLDIQRDNLTAAKEQENFKRLTAEGVAQLDPLDPEYEQRVQEVYQTAKDSAIQNSQFKTREVSDKFGTILEHQTIGGLALADVHRRSALDKEGKRLRGQIEDSTYAAIRQDPDGYEAYLKEFNTQAGRVTPSIKPSEVPGLDARFADTAIIARAEGYAQQGRFSEAKAVLEANQAALSPESFRNGKRVIREQETQQKQDRLAGTAAAIADVEVKIIDAQTTADFTRLRAQVEQMDAGGFFADREEKKVSMIRQIEHQREIMARGEQYAATRLDQFDRGLGSNNQQDADLVWERVAERHRAANPQATTEQWVSWAGQYAAQSGWVPSQYRNIMANAERTDNVDLVETGARLYDRFRAAAPEADTGTRERGGRVRLTSATRELLGMDYSQAAQFILDRAPDEATLKARQKKFDEDFKSFDSRKMLVDAGIAQAGWFKTPDEVPESVARQYEKTLRLHYDLVGDPTIAKTAADKRFKEEYGVSSIGGRRAVVRMPPENFFPGASNTSLKPEQKARIVDEDIGRSLKALGVEPGVVVYGERDEYVEDPATGILTATGKKIKGDTSGIAPYQLAFDQQTERDISAGVPVSYELRVRNSFGVMVPVPVEKNGVTRNLRYTMPTVEQLQADPTYQEIGRTAAKDAADWKSLRDNVLLPDMRRYPYRRKTQ